MSDNLSLFDGTFTDDEHDEKDARLLSQLEAVYELMRDGQWRQLADVASIVGAPSASVSARLRDLRKPRFGAHVVDRRHVADGLYEYRLSVTGPLLDGSGFRSPKIEARKRVSAFLAEFVDRNQRSIITSCGGAELTVDDLQALLR